MTHKPVYIVDAIRSPVVKADGVFMHHRPDNLLAKLLQTILSRNPTLPAKLIDDVVIGCAMPEAEQGLNIARNALLLAGFPNTVSGMTVNRFCASGLQSIAIVANQIAIGQTQAGIAGGIESMSMIAMTGNRPRFNSKIFEDDRIGMAFGMGITAEQVAKQFKINRESQDIFALQSHQKAKFAIEQGWFDPEIIPIEVIKKHLNSEQEIINTPQTIYQDNGLRFDTSLDKLSQLKSVFAKDGTVTAGNTSQRSDGGAVVMLCNEKTLKQFNLTPLAEFVGFSVAGVPPEMMGIGPLEAIPKVLKNAQLTLDDMDVIELNEAFAAQSLAVINTLDINENKINLQGGAIALGHPLGATGAIRTTTALNILNRKKLTYAMITMCIGGGMGAAGIIKRC